MTKTKQPLAVAAREPFGRAAALVDEQRIGQIVRQVMK